MDTSRAYVTWPSDPRTMVRIAIVALLCDMSLSSAKRHAKLGHFGGKNLALPGSKRGNWRYPAGQVAAFLGLTGVCSPHDPRGEPVAEAVAAPAERVADAGARPKSPRVKEVSVPADRPRRRGPKVVLGGDPGPRTEGVGRLVVARVPTPGSAEAEADLFARWGGRDAA